MTSNHVSAPALPPPPPVTASPPVFSGLLSDYAAWNAHFACVLRLSKLADDADKSAMLFCALAPTAQRTLMALISPKTIDDVKFKGLHSTLDQHYRVTPLLLAKYFKFFAARQDPDQSSADYVIQLCTLATSCSWPISLDPALVIVFVMGVSSNQLRQQLLQRDHPSIDLALEQANQYDSILRETLRTSSSHPASSANLAASVNQVRAISKGTSAALPCYRCAMNDHRDDSCWYRQAICNSCSKVGHIARACRSKPRPSQRPQSPQQSQPSQRRSSSRGRRRREYAKMNKVVFSIDAIQLSSSDAAGRSHSVRPPSSDAAIQMRSDQPPLYVRPLSDRPPPSGRPLSDRPPYNVAAVRPPAAQRPLSIDNDARLRSSNDSMGNNRPFTIDLQIKGRPARLEVNTGAAVTVINSSLWRDLGKPRLKKSSAICRSFSGQKIAIRGPAAVHIDYKGKSTRLQLLVAENALRRIAAVAGLLDPTLPAIAGRFATTRLHVIGRLAAARLLSQFISLLPPRPRDESPLLLPLPQDESSSLLPLLQNDFSSSPPLPRDASSSPLPLPQDKSSSLLPLLQNDSSPSLLLLQNDFSSSLPLPQDVSSSSPPRPRDVSSSSLAPPQNDSPMKPLQKGWSAHLPLRFDQDRRLLHARRVSSTLKFEEEEGRRPKLPQRYQTTLHPADEPPAIGRIKSYSAAQPDPEPQHVSAPHYDPEPLNDAAPPFDSMPLNDLAPPNDPDR
uniref:CCHC-type domain-containing protein n=1 Tax=Plectus sambesii TaxID=2011161 RepID=A0A914V162_9BILA